MTKTPAELFAMIFGAVYTLAGIAGFFVVDGHDFAGPDGGSLLGFEVNGLHNIVHIAIGLVLLLASRTPESARSTNMIVGALLGVVGVIGWFVGDSEANLLALGASDNILHLGTALLAFTVGRNVSRSGTAARA